MDLQTIGTARSVGTVVQSSMHCCENSVNTLPERFLGTDRLCSHQVSDSKPW